MRISILTNILFTLLIFSGIASNDAFAKPPKGKKKVSLLRKGWDDVTTRNNYYFNANKKYSEMVKNYMKTRTLNYNDTLPFYFYEGVDFSGQKLILDQVIIKTGVVLQRHEYSRWKDNCYDLLGRAYFLKGNYDTALITFQYLVTNMKGKFNNSKSAISQKEVLKAKKAKQKELNKVNDAKKKDMEKRQKEKEAALAKSSAEKKERMEDAAKHKEKDLQAKIKAKEKMLKQKAKGKYKAPVTNSKTATKSGNKKNAGEVMDKVMGGISITPTGKADPKALKEAEAKANAIEAEKARLEQLDVEDSLRKEQEKKDDKLSLWEKIKHKKSRPETLTWLAKTYIARNEMQDAESIISYSQALRRLTRKQKKEIALVNAFYQYKTKKGKIAIEALEEAIPLIKKKTEKTYYQFVLAQWIEQANPSAAIPHYINVRNNTKNEEVDYFALQQIARLYTQGKSDAIDTAYLENEFIKAGKSKLYGAQAHYVLASLQLQRKDTTKAFEHLLKSIQLCGNNAEQRALSLLKWGDISFLQSDYQTATARYDSALLVLPLTYPGHDSLENRKKNLQDLYRYVSTLQQQDSLLKLSALSKAELAEFIKQQQKIENKIERKSARKGGDDATFSSTGLGDNASFDVSQDKFVDKGVWYFYNTDFKSRGFTEFKRVWGDRKLQNNWRRVGANQFGNLANTEDTIASDKTKSATATLKPILKIPETQEEKDISHQIIEESYFSMGKVFWEKFNEEDRSLQAFNQQLSSYPEGKLAPTAIYYVFMMMRTLNNDKEAERYARMLIKDFPEHELTAKVRRLYDTQLIASTEKEKNADEKLYASLYNDFSNGYFENVIEGRKAFSDRFGNDSKLMAKVAFLEALSHAKCGDTATYKKSMAIIAKQYPNSPESTKAKYYLAVAETIGTTPTKDSVVSNTTTEIKEPEIFKISQGTHFILILLKERNANLTPVITSLNTYLETLFPGQKMKATSSFLDNNTPMILIKRFNTIPEGEKCREDLLKNKSQWLTNNETIPLDILLISQDNFKELFIRKNLDVYLKFYQKNYKQ